MKIKLFVVFVFMALCSFAGGEKTDINIFGDVKDKNGEHLPFVNIVVKGSPIGASTNGSGHYMINNIPLGKHVLVVQYMGYKTIEKEIVIERGKHQEINFVLEEAQVALEQMVVTATMKEQSLKNTPVKVEVITGNFLNKNGACDITECIGMINGVQKTSSCSACGNSEIRINGMEGPNTAILIDGMPIMGALASVYGLSGIPNSIIERIEVIKGPSSTLYGSEAVGGVINVITKKPEKADPFTFSTKWTSIGEKHADFSFTPFKKNRKVAALFSGDIYSMENFVDVNKDQITDMPLLRPRLSVFNKWSFKRKEDRVFTLAAKYYHEKRMGGQRSFLGEYDWTRDNAFRGSDSLYGETVFTDRAEVMGSYQLPTKEYIRLDFTSSYHNQNSIYGQTDFQAYQYISFANLIWTKLIKRHDLLAGLSFRNNIYDDNTAVTKDGADVQYIPGVFVQDEFNWTEKVRLLGGLRYDYHKHSGNVFSPRFNVMYKPNRTTSIRLNTGTGYRLVNLFSEDHASYHGFRTVVVTEDIKPERSYNATLNLNKVIQRGKYMGTIDVDVFYTHFQNKIIADYETDVNKIIYQNLSQNEFAVSKGVSVSMKNEFAIPLEIGYGATYQHIYAMQENTSGKVEQDFIDLSPRFSAVYNICYELKKYHLDIDLTGRFTGSMPLPTPDPAIVNDDQLSEPYMIHGLQLSYQKLKDTKIYLGVDNLLDWKPQQQPIIHWQDPFSDEFDTGNVFGPIHGRVIYLGLKYAL